MQANYKCSCHESEKHNVNILGIKVLSLSVDGMERIDFFEMLNVFWS